MNEVTIFRVALKAGNLEKNKKWKKYPRSVELVVLRSVGMFTVVNINLLKTKRNLLYIRKQFVPRSKLFQPCYKNQSVSAV